MNQTVSTHGVDLLGSRPLAGSDAMPIFPHAAAMIATKARILTAT
jgi:hypothetical protein